MGRIACGVFLLLELEILDTLLKDFLDRTITGDGDREREVTVSRWTLLFLFIEELLYNRTIGSK